MGFNSKIKTVGGGGAKPVADNFNQFLVEMLNSSGFKENISGMFSGGNNPVSPMPAVDMNDPQFAAAGQLFDRQQAQNINDLRSRFGASGGAPRGSAAQFAESQYRAQSDPTRVMAMNDISNSIREQNRADRVITSSEKQFEDQKQMQVLSQIFASLMDANRLGTPQAETVEQPSAFSQIFGAVSGLAPYALAPFTGGASLGLAGLGMGGGGRSGGGGIMPPMRGGSPITTQGRDLYRNLPPVRYPGLG